jgi:hypothetical protein
MVYCGMGGPAGLPFGASPFVKNWTRPFSPQLFHRGLVDVRSGAAAAQPGTGPRGANPSGLPLSHFVLSGIPALRGVWQSPHLPISFTRYRPRFTASALSCAKPASGQTKHNTLTKTLSKLRRMAPAYQTCRGQANQRPRLDDILGGTCSRILSFTWYRGDEPWDLWKKQKSSPEL